MSTLSKILLFVVVVLLGIGIFLGIGLSNAANNPIKVVVVQTPTPDVVAMRMSNLEATNAALQKTLTASTSISPTLAPTQAPVVQPTLAPEPTKAPEPTSLPTLAPTAMPVAVSCDTPSIKAGLQKADTEFGEFLDTTLGKRMTFTSRKVVVPTKAWNVALTADELKSVETTVLYMQICVPEGMSGTIFSGGFEQKLNRYENGVLMTLKPGLYEFKIRNAEVVLWYPGQDSFAAKDLDRIIAQIRVGNFDIKSPLAFFGVTTDLLPKIPDDLAKERNVQIIPFAEPMVK